MDKLKELFGKYAEKICANGDCDECGCGTTIESQSKYLSESQFKSVVEEYNKQRNAYEEIFEILTDYSYRIFDIDFAVKLENGNLVPDTTYSGAVIGNENLSGYDYSIMLDCYEEWFKPTETKEGIYSAQILVKIYKDGDSDFKYTKLNYCGTVKEREEAERNAKEFEIDLNNIFGELKE